MSIKALFWSFDCHLERSSDKFVLIALANFASENDYCFPSIQTIAEITRLDRKTIVGCIARLVDTGFIVDTGKRVGATQRVVVYRLQIDSTKNGTIGAAETVPKTDGNSPVFPPEQSRFSPLIVPKTVLRTSREHTENIQSNLRDENRSVDKFVDKLPTDWRQQLESVYPKRAGVAGFAGVKLMLKLRSALIEHDWSQIIEGAQRYAEFCEKDGKTGTSFVKAIGNWIEERGYLEAYDYRPPLSAAEREREQIAERDRARMAAAVEAGKRLRTPLHPLPGESAGAFETRVRLASDGISANSGNTRKDMAGNSGGSPKSDAQLDSDALLSRSHDELRRRIGRTAMKLKA